LDREAVALYRFFVTATDGHLTKPLSSSAAVSVKVQDVNDNFPSFLYGPYVANVPAGITKGKCTHYYSYPNICIQCSLTTAFKNNNNSQFLLCILQDQLSAQ